MSITRAARMERQIEMLCSLYDEHPGGSSRRACAEATGAPETSIHGLNCKLRRRSTELGHIPAALKQGGVWMYGWAETLRDTREEHLKRIKSEKRSLLLSIEMVEQSVAEYPDALDLRRLQVSKQNRLNEINLEVAELSGQLRSLTPFGEHEDA